MENFKDNLIAKIKQGEVKMHSKSYFILKSILYGILALFMLLIATMMIVFVFYVFKLNGLLCLPTFGLKGMRDFLLSIPWLLLILTGIFIVVSSVFLKQYPVTYRRPLIYSIASLLLIFSLGTILFIKTPDLRQNVYMTAELVNIPIFSSLYEDYKQVGARNISMGRVVIVTRDGFVIVNQEGVRLLIATGPQTSFYMDGNIEQGDYIIVHGRQNGQVIGAFAIEKIID